MSPVVIVGTGRCGTGWAATVLNAAGVRCGHQDLIRHEHVLADTPVRFGDYRAEASFEALPLVDRLRAEGHHVVGLVRHPLRVVRSWVELGAFGDDMDAHFGMWAEVLRQCWPEVLTERTPIERAARWWVAANRTILAGGVPSATVEGLSADGLLDLCRLRVESSPHPVSPRNRRQGDKRRTLELCWADLPSALRADVSSAAATFGFDADVEVVW